MSIKINEVDKVEDVEIENEELEGKEIEIRQYLPILEKLSFITTIYESTVETEGNRHIINSTWFDVFYKTGLIREYSDVELPEDSIEAYDLITSTGLYEHVYNEIPESEIVELERIVSNYINDREKAFAQDNSIGSVVLELAKGATGLLKEVGGAISGADSDVVSLFLSQLGAGDDNVNSDKLQPVASGTKKSKK